MYTARFLVLPVNDPPVANDDFYTTDEDVKFGKLFDFDHFVARAGLFNGYPRGFVLLNDTDIDNDLLTSSLVTQPSHGFVSMDILGYFVYTPQANYNGYDSFTYKANDSTVESNVATVTIYIKPVNDPPVANNDYYTTKEDIKFGYLAPIGKRVIARGFVLLNDTDLENDLLFSTLVTQPTHGQVQMDQYGFFTYTPSLNYNGYDSFTYKARDTNDSNIATVTIYIEPVNDAPIANTDYYTTKEDEKFGYLFDFDHWVGRNVPNYPRGFVLLNDIDVENDLLTCILMTQPSHGSVSMDSLGYFVYTPQPNYYGFDTFTYKANDGFLDSNVTTVTIYVEPVNDLAVPLDDYYATFEDQPLVVTAPGIFINDYDVDNSSAYWQAYILITPVNGEVILGNNGGFTFTPQPNFVEYAWFTYGVS